MGIYALTGGAGDVQTRQNMENEIKGFTNPAVMAGNISAGGASSTGLMSNLNAFNQNMPAPIDVNSYFSGIKVPDVPYPTLPSYSNAVERSAQQRYAAPITSKLRLGLLNALQRARNAGGRWNSQATRDALSGYGEGMSAALGGALGGAQRFARQQQLDEQQGLLGAYNAQNQRATIEYQLAQQRALAALQQAQTDRTAQMGLLGQQARNQSTAINQPYTNPRTNTLQLLPGGGGIPLNTAELPSGYPKDGVSVTHGQPYQSSDTTGQTKTYEQEMNERFGGNDWTLTGYPGGGL